MSNVAVPLVVTQAAGNTHDGSASWSYSVPDGAFDFLGTGEILTLTYTATVDDGHGGVVTKPITVTVTGTNDTPGDHQRHARRATSPKSPMTTNASTPDQATGTITFIDPDLTDTHAVTITDVGVTGGCTGLANACHRAGLAIAGHADHSRQRGDRLARLDVLGRGRQLRLPGRRRDADRHL